MSNNISINQEQSYYFCIYRITNLINNKTYIGQHKYSIKYNNNPLYKYKGSGSVLHRAYQKYGIENFKKEVLIKEITTSEVCDFLEKNLIWAERFLKNKNNVYNQANGGNKMHLHLPKINSVNKELHWYNNGKNEILSNYQPDGFVKGRLKTSCLNFTINNSIRKNPCKNTHIYNNGIIEVRNTYCPDGFVKGRLKASIVGLNQYNNNLPWNKNKTNIYSKETLNKISLSKRGKHWYNNGQISVLRETCPENFVKGRL